MFDYMTPEQTEQYSYIYIPRSLMTGVTPSSRVRR